MGFFNNNRVKFEAPEEEQKNLLQEMEEGDSLVYKDVRIDEIYEKYKTEIDGLLLPGEELEAVHPLIIDYLCITSKRLIFVDKALMNDSLEIVSVPYKNITDASLIKGHLFKFTNELKVRTKGKDHELKFIKGREVLEIYNKIMEKILD